MELPEAFKSWLLKYIEINPPELPITGMAGYQAPTKVTTGAFSVGPPSNPRDTDIWVATNVDGNGTRWQFQYNASSSSANKWEFIGGPPIVLEQDTFGSWTVSAWAIFGATLWSVIRSGDYLSWGSWSGASPSAPGNAAEKAGVMVNTGSGYAAPTLRSATETTAASVPFDVVVPPTRVSVAVANQIVLGYWVDTAPSGFQFASLSICPVRVS